MNGCHYKRNADGYFQCTKSGWALNEKTPHAPQGTCPICSKKQFIESMAKHPIPKPGPGTQLHLLLKTLAGEDIEPDCQCKSRIAEMDQRGPAWCREHVDVIVDWLIEEADRRLKRAKASGWRLRLGGLKFPGRRLVLRWFVLWAVRRAEREVP